jgi:uncharacterized protein with NRDE domain
VCLLVLAWNAHPRYRLVVAANRDEYHDRPSAPLGPWPGPHEILAGRDLRAGGTWLGIDRRRRFGIVTNFRDLMGAPPQAPSRGGLIPGYLGGASAPSDYLAALEPEAASYGGFNLLLADGESIWYASNRGTSFARALTPGVHGLSNEQLDTPWPKLLRVRRGFEGWLRGDASVDDGELFALLADRTQAPEEGLPSTGVSPEWERTLSSPFVLNPRYGTRCSTLVAMESTGACFIAERRFDPSGALSGETEYRLGPGEWPGPGRAE